MTPDVIEKLNNMRSDIKLLEPESFEFHIQVAIVGFF